MISLSLRKEYFDGIKTGLKTVEGRLNNQKFIGLKSEDLINFTLVDSDEFIKCKIKEINRYLTFKEMLETEGVQNMLPGIESLEKAIQIYESFPSYKEKVKEIGALAIKIELL
jgi:ASC-1-like (ASCH) protein